MPGWGVREEEGVSAGVDVCRTDLEHRLAARERELRAIAAEKDVLSQQARAAWSLLDERTAAAHELEVTPPPSWLGSVSTQLKLLGASCP